MSPLGPSHTTTAGPGYSSIAGTQDKHLKIPFINMIEVLIEEMKKSRKTNNIRK